MKIVLATHNPHKVKEIRHYFKELHVDLISLEAFPGVALKEEGETLMENALQKARMTAKETGSWALGDDTGLFVTALEGRPGIFSARYAGEEATFGENIRKLLANMEGVPGEERGAYFSSVLALVHLDGREVTVEGRLEGTVAEGPRGKDGFGYDPIFWLPDRRCTLAELSLEEKNKMSHRGKALRKMKGVIEGLIRVFGV